MNNLVCKDVEKIIFSYLEQCPNCHYYNDNKGYYIVKCKCNYGNYCLHNFKCGSETWNYIVICDSCRPTINKPTLTEIEYFTMIENEIMRNDITYTRQRYNRTLRSKYWIINM